MKGFQCAQTEVQKGLHDKKGMILLYFRRVKLGLVKVLFAANRYPRFSLSVGPISVLRYLFWAQD